MSSMSSKKAKSKSLGKHHATATSAGPNKQLTVEKVLDSRKNPDTGVLEYLLKWEGFDEGHNSWEPAENLFCPALVAYYEEQEARRKEAEREVLKVPSMLDMDATAVTSGSSEVTAEAIRGLMPETVMAATDETGELTFLMKWKDRDEADLVPAKQANLLYPQLVIKFYERHLIFKEDEKENQDT